MPMACLPAVSDIACSEVSYAPHGSCNQTTSIDSFQCTGCLEYFVGKKSKALSRFQKIGRHDQLVIAVLGMEAQGWWVQDLYPS